MFILYNAAGCGYWLSSAANYVAGSIVSFFINKYWTFKVRSWSLYMVIGFIIAIIISYFIAYGAAKPLMNYLFKNYQLNIRENIAMFAGMCLYTGINYLLQRFVVFKISKQPERPQ